MGDVRDDGEGRESSTESDVIACVRVLMEYSGGAEVRTSHGSWRLVIAIYSDRTLGTIRASSAGGPGRFTVMEAERIADVRAADRVDARAVN